MKVLHLSGEPEDVGGILTVIRNLQTAMREVCEHVVCVNRRYVELRRPALSYRVSRYICSDSPSHLQILLNSVRAYSEIKRMLQREQFDIVHAHTRGALFVAVALARHRCWPVLFTNHSYARRVGLYQWAARQPNVSTVLLTPNMARHYGLVEQPPKTNIISACCADEFFTEPLPGERPPVQDRTVRFVGIGNIMRWKHWDLIADAIKRLPAQEQNRVEFSLWGPTPADADSQAYDRELRRRVEELQLQHRFLFRGTTHSIVDAVRDADWFLLPSTNEPCSVALMEVLALGIPALVTASGGNLDILQPERTGLWFRPDDAGDLALNLRRILNGEVKLVPAADRRKSVRHRSASKVASQYLALYREMQRQRSD